MEHINIDISNLDYSKPISYYAVKYGLSYSTIKRRLIKLGIFNNFYFVSGENTQKLKSLQMREKYEHSPKLCLECRNKIPFDSKENNCCSRSCSRIFYAKTHKDEMKKRGRQHSLSFKSNDWTVNEKSLKNLTHINEGVKITIVCQNCSKTFETYPSSKNRKFCSKKCSDIGSDKTKMGGIRTGSGRGKRGWYKGHYCSSSWELAWVIYNLDHDVKFTRNTMGFDYIFEDKNRKYFPDYIMEDGSFLEIKGYKSPQWEAKVKYFPYKIKTLYEEDIKCILEYVIQKYGHNFTNLYGDVDKLV